VLRTVGAPRRSGVAVDWATCRPGVPGPSRGDTDENRRPDTAHSATGATGGGRRVGDDRRGRVVGPGSISINSEDVRGLRALLEIANDKSCAEATRELARLGLTGYLSSILGEPPVIEDGGACD
jgi:hypothetical protein